MQTWNKPPMVTILAKIMCNVQPEKNLGNCNPAKGLSAAIEAESMSGRR